ncbi:M56 family metallopeptidase [Nocardia jejuensis]|uniref:M56 family metallopeptidase n=1 Tax=Nocardia jejuensis TaxID=328049 RepID=UPI00082B560D|nr:M56 family metallopeptidase [Nocardia jejuensis]
MILITALLAAGIALAAATPAVLSRIDFTAAPLAGMVAWLGASVATLGCGVLVLIALLWPGDPPGEFLAGSVLESLGAIEPMVVTWTAGLILPVAAIGITVPTGQLARIAIGHRGRGAALRRRHNELVRVLGRADPTSANLVWLDHPIPLAYSVAGRDGYIVVTEGLARCLDEAQWRAVLAHERAHLRGRHHHVLGVSRVLAQAFWWVPLFGAAPAALATLVELAADRTAAVSTGPLALHSALHAVAAHAGTTPLDLIDESLTVRLECLSAAPESRTASRRTATLLLLATSLLAPAAAAFTVGLSAALAGLLIG